MSRLSPSTLGMKSPASQGERGKDLPDQSDRGSEGFYGKMLKIEEIFYKQMGSGKFIQKCTSKSSTIEKTRKSVMTRI